MANNSKWIDFVTVRNSSWRAGNVVLLGDAAHTAHFSIGSGTKLAMEDAVALAWALRCSRRGHRAGRWPPTRRSAGRSWRARSARRRRRSSGSRGSAGTSGQERLQFAFNLLTRSRRVTYDNLRLRDPEFVAEVHPDPRPPMFMPFSLRGLELPNRVVVSAMDMYSAVDGTPGDFHLVHLGARALGGAGLVMTEMACVSAEGRITPGCAGMYTDEHVGAWKRIVDFVHEQANCAIGAQLGHSGRKGSTKLMWDGIDEPLPDGNWPLIAPSPLPYGPDNQVPREMSASRPGRRARAVRRRRPGSGRSRV